jgi:hypothetical protein
MRRCRPALLRQPGLQCGPDVPSRSVWLIQEKARNQFVEGYTPSYTIVGGRFVARTLADESADCTAVIAAFP